jgi:putative addiction module killer protein
MTIEVKQTPEYSRWHGKLKDKNAKARIDIRIRHVQTGTIGDTVPVGDGIFELRIDYGPGYRIYATWEGKTLIILLWGSDKSTQQREIAKAKQLKKKYLG